MIDIKELEHLAPMANEMLSGLHADEAMKRRILSAAREEKKRSVSMPRLVPALCCAALAVACIGMFAPRLTLPRIFGLKGVWMSFPCGDIGGSIIAACFLIWIIRWLKSPQALAVK